MTITTPDTRAQERLAVRLRAAFEDSPIEDGMTHPAEAIIADALRSATDSQPLHWLKSICTDASQPRLAASTLRCLGRIAGAGAPQWRVKLVRDALASDNLEMRDAAVQAAESWADPGMVAVLASHSDPQEWLQQYIRDVIDDLSA